MPGTLLHSPADVMRRALIVVGQGTAPGGTWPIFAAEEPDVPDACITVFDTQGTDGGRTMPDAERVEHNGIQVRVRSATHQAGYAKARTVALALDAMRLLPVTMPDGSHYLVWTAVRTSDVLPIGTEPESERNIFTINAVASLRKL